MKKTRLMLVPVVILCVILIITMLSGYSEKVNEEIANGVIRLHVIANSDSPEDQALKCKVRDNILDYMRGRADQCFDGYNNLKVDDKLLGELKKVATETIKMDGKVYDVSTQFGNFAFPTKTYGDLSFPAGYYNAVRVVIGSGAGKNWWCVMFPPLCMLNSTTGKLTDDSKLMLRQRVGEEDFSILSSGPKDGSADGAPQINVKFKVVEVFQSLKIGWDNLFGIK